MTVDTPTTTATGDRVGTSRLRWWIGSVSASAAMALVYGRAVFGPGYLLLIDTAWGPRAPKVESGFYLPISALQRLVFAVVGGSATGKLYVLSVLFACALGPMVVFRRSPWWLRLVVGFLGLANPWVYERVIEGQWTVAAAGAALFFWLAAVDSLERAPGPRPAISVAVATVAATACSPAFLPMIALLALLRVPTSRRFREPAQRRWGLAALAAAGVGLVYGVVGFAAGHSAQTYSRVRSFGLADFETFRSFDVPFGLIPRLVGFEGYWAERVTRFPTLDHAARWWPLVAFILGALTFAAAWRVRDRAWLLVAAIIGVAVAASTAVPGGARTAAALARHLPFLGSFREPGKWTALWLLAVVVLLGELIGSLQPPAWPAGAPRWAAPGLAAAVVSLTLLLGAAHELDDLAFALRPVRYPDDWSAAATALARSVGPGERVVVLPWHLYVDLDFARHRVVQNPAPVFFPGRLLTSDDPEVTTHRSTDPRDIGTPAADPAGSGCRLADAVRANAVRWVVVLPTLEGPDDQVALMRCGFTRSLGDADHVSVLHG